MYSGIGNAALELKLNLSRAIQQNSHRARPRKTGQSKVGPQTLAGIFDVHS